MFSYRSSVPNAGGDRKLTERVAGQATAFRKMQIVAERTVCLIS